MTHNSKYSVDILKQHLTLLCGNRVRRRKPLYPQINQHTCKFLRFSNYIDGLSNIIENTKTFVTGYL